MQFTCPKCRRVTNLPHPVHGDKRSITCGCGQVCEVPSLAELQNLGARRAHCDDKAVECIHVHVITIRVSGHGSDAHVAE